jgi:hypothetical protein
MNPVADDELWESADLGEFDECVRLLRANVNVNSVYM